MDITRGKAVKTYVQYIKWVNVTMIIGQNRN